MDRLEQIKNEVIQEDGNYRDWESYMDDQPYGASDYMVNEVARRYATEMVRHDRERVMSEARVIHTGTGKGGRMKEQKLIEIMRNQHGSLDVYLKQEHLYTYVLNSMQSYSDQQNAELRERVKELEAQNKRLKIAHYAIVRAYEEYGPLAAVSTKQVSENVLKETEFDPSKETL